MATLRTCSGCKSTVDISYFGMNRKENHIKHAKTVEIEIRKKQRGNQINLLRIH